MISMSKMVVYLPEGTLRYIKVIEVALWRVVSLHFLKYRLIKCAFILDENYRSLSIIP